MTASPDRPSTARKFVVDAMSINPLRTAPGKHNRNAEGPIHVWHLDPSPVHLTLWSHPVPPISRAVPIITDLMRTLESRRWRFDIEHLPSEVGRAFRWLHPDAEGFQLVLWLNPMHLPADYLPTPEDAAKGPGVPRVMLFDVPAPDRIPEPGDNDTETISGVAEGFADRPAGSIAVVDLSIPDVVSHQGIVSICHQPVPPAGLYLSHDELDKARAES